MDTVSVEKLTEYSDEAARQLGRLMPFLSEHFTDDPVDQELLEAIIGSPYHDQLVAKLEGRIVGAATMSVMMGVGAERVGYLEDFVTDPTLRNQGIGSKVWDEIVKWCQEQGIVAGFDFTSNPNRNAAHSFYRAYGGQIRRTTAFHVDVS
jgi:ribosomal protein S18 acetylase RimI-like enzyme